jgi:hypothetical protein
VVGASASRAPFDEVVGTIRSGVVLDVFGVDASVRLPARFTAAAAMNAGAVRDGTGGDNDRWGANASLTWSRSRASALIVRTRVFGYERTASDGYFSPRRFQITELAARWHRSQPLGWQVGGDVSVGSQRVRVRDDAAASGRAAWSASATGGFRWRPGFEVVGSVTAANVASPGALLADAEYRYRVVTAGMRWLF